MIKVIAAAQRHPANRTLLAARDYWAETHGPLFANSKALRRYVQHLTLPDAYGVDPAPTFDGVSMFWYDEYEPFGLPTNDPEIRGLLEAVLGVKPKPVAKPVESAEADPMLTLTYAVLRDDYQLFDRSTTWPMHDRRAFVFADEHIVLDGQVTPDMVKAIFVVSKLPGLTLDEFFDHWLHHHGPVATQLPGLRRYAQNHALPEGYVDRCQTHDGWSELWFDDLAALQSAARSTEWASVRASGAALFAQPVGVGVARERVQKDLDWTYKDWGVNSMSEGEIHQRLVKDGYTTLASDPDAPSKIKTAAAAEALVVWTREHLVTIDNSRIDVRPER